jgi:DNA-binding transcriptional MerR regulator
MLAPSQLASLLRVSTSSLRRWSVLFEDNLSPRVSKHRSYSPDDYEVLKRVRDLSSEGVELSDIKRMLGAVVVEQSESKALVSYEDFIDILNVSRSTIQKLQSKVDQQEQELKAIRDYLALPFYKRLGRRRPG